MSSARRKAKATGSVDGSCEARVLELVIKFYLGSHDFNGMPAARLQAARVAGWRKALRRLVQQHRIEVVTEKMAVNPHVKLFPSPSIDKQLAALEAADELVRVCLYPHSSTLADRVDRNTYDGRPYALALALGAPQLEHRGFNLSVLETYRNDPRYVYHCDDLHGWISISDDYYRSDETAERDKILLESFGFGSVGKTIAISENFVGDRCGARSR